MQSRLIRRLFSDPSMRTAEVVAHEPAMQVVIHLLSRAVALRLGRILFGQPVHPLHHSIGLGRVRQGRSMLNLLVLTDLIKLMRGRNLGSIAVLEAVERELASVISQNLRDLERIKSQAPRQEICRRLLVLAFLSLLSYTQRSDKRVARSMATKQ